MHIILKRPDQKINLLVAMQTALRQDPDIIVVCLPKEGATQQRTYEMMQFLSEDLPQHKKARLTDGGVSLFFTQPEFADEIYPEGWLQAWIKDGMKF